MHGEGQLGAVKVMLSVPPDFPPLSMNVYVTAICENVKLTASVVRALPPDPEVCKDSSTMLVSW
jgi:hypothetical protein